MYTVRIDSDTNKDFNFVFTYDDIPSVKEKLEKDISEVLVNRPDDAKFFLEGFSSYRCRITNFSHDEANIPHSLAYFIRYWITVADFERRLKDSTETVTFDEFCHHSNMELHIIRRMGLDNMVWSVKLIKDHQAIIQITDDPEVKKLNMDNLACEQGETVDEAICKTVDKLNLFIDKYNKEEKNGYICNITMKDKIVIELPKAHIVL